MSARLLRQSREGIAGWTRLRSIRPLRCSGSGGEPTYTRAQARSISQGLYRALLDRRVDEAEALLEQIYQGLLGRPADPGGRRTYLERIERRRHAAVVMAIVESREFRNRLPR